jgi:hypothetical protein
VLLTGVFLFDGSPADPTTLLHVRLTGEVLARDQHRVVLDRLVTQPGSAVVLRSPGSMLLNSTIDRPGPGVASFENAGVVLGAAGVQMLRTTVRNAFAAAVAIEAAAVLVSQCEVTGARGDGFRVTTATSLRIIDCNIEQNAGFGVNNLHGDPLDARNNWWGDPAGPAGPAGDGVSGNVLVAPFRQQRITVQDNSALRR